MYFELCSIYSLTCLTRDDMIAIASKFEMISGWHCIQPIKTGPNKLVSPRAVESAGRYILNEIQNQQIAIVAIFSVSIPFDVMVNIEVNIKGDVTRCLQKVDDYRHLIENYIHPIINTIDIQCITFCSDTESIRIFAQVVRDKYTGSEIEILYSSDELTIVSASYPLDCLLIVGTSETIVAESQTVIQNLYRIRGGSQHINNKIQMLNTSVINIEDQVRQLATDKKPAGVKESLEVLRDLRVNLFEIQHEYSAIDAEFGNLREYESLYLEDEEHKLNPYLPFKQNIKNAYLLPVKLLKKDIENRFRNASKFIEDALSINYADINLQLLKSTSILQYIQVIIAILLFIITIISINPELVKQAGQISVSSTPNSIVVEPKPQTSKPRMTVPPEKAPEHSKK